MVAACVSGNTTHFGASDTEGSVVDLDAQPVPDGRALLGILCEIESLTHPVVADVYTSVTPRRCSSM